MSAVFHKHFFFCVIRQTCTGNSKFLRVEATAQSFSDIKAVSSDVLKNSISDFFSDVMTTS
jgi:hypothetical protein